MGGIWQGLNKIEQCSVSHSPARKDKRINPMRIPKSQCPLQVPVFMNHLGLPPRLGSHVPMGFRPKAVSSASQGFWLLLGS